MKKLFYSKLYWFLIKTCHYGANNKYFKPIWNRLWSYSSNNYQGTIDFRLHGENVVLNNCNMYPLFKTLYPLLNNPILEVIYQIFDQNKRPLNFIDVGAAFGDTMLLINQKCPGMIGKFYCIDGDQEFFVYQKYNLRNLKNGTLINAFLSDHKTKFEPELLRTHSGTASAQGVNKIPTKTLDEIIINEQNADTIDFIKIDVDGLDGKIIGGAVNILDKFKPIVIFEWHPKLILKTNNSLFEAYDILKKYKYQHFIIFDKIGTTATYYYNINEKELKILLEFSLKNKFDSDWHYDVIAIQNTNEKFVLNIMQLTNSRYL
jgi:FkbM family methyltransferase